MTQHSQIPTDVAAAEREALQVQEAEDHAELRFDQARAALLEGGRTEDVKSLPELADWLAARARTDAAWGRWAVAKDAAEEVSAGAK